MADESVNWRWMSNSVIRYGIASSVAFVLTFVTLADSSHAAKKVGASKPQRNSGVSSSRRFVWNTAQDKIAHPLGISAVIKESNRQALKLLASQTKALTKDVAISPVASTAVYLLLLNGLRGSSRAELANAMKVNQINDQQLADLTSRYLKSLESTSPKCVVGVAGATNSPLKFQPKYSKLISERFGGLILNDAQSNLEQLRGFMRTKTDGRFGDSLQGPLPSVIELYSTLYFNGIWSDKFLSSWTKKESFKKADGTRIMVPMMHKSFEGYGALYLNAKDFQALRMPYLPSSTPDKVFDAMYIILPKMGVPLSKLMDDLSKTGLESYSSSWRMMQGNLSIPRFKIETDELDIPFPTSNGKTLNANNVDVGGMCHNAPSANIVTKQWTTLDFNENGTIAAAMTVCTMTVGGGDKEMFTMRVDRPFAFVLGNSRTGAYLFAGTVQNPRDSKMPFAEAEREWLKRLDAIGKKNTDGYCLQSKSVAEFYRSEGKLAKAEELLTDASRLDSAPWAKTEVLFDLAQILEQEKKYKEADQVYKDLLSIHRREVRKFSSYYLLYPQIAWYKRYLEGYAKLLSIMKADRSRLNAELERFYQRLLASELEEFSKIPADDDMWREGTIQNIVDDKVMLAEFYETIGQTAEARKSYEGAIATLFASPKPRYTRAIQLGKRYLNLVKDPSLEHELKKMQTNIADWTIKSSSLVKKNVGRHRR